MSLSLKNLLLPLLVLAFVGVAVTFLTSIFNTATRWLVLGVFTLYVLYRGRIFGVLKLKVTIAVFVYCVWGILTSIWSEQQYLSLLKSSAAMLVTIPVMAGGYLWARDRPVEDVFNLLIPLTMAALAAGLLGRFSTAAIVYAGRTVLYQGLVNGPNMFGSMLAVCSPLLIWKLHHSWSDKRWRAVWLAAALLGAYYLSAASSRGAILVVLVSVTMFLTTISLAKKVRLLLFASMAISAVLMVVPNGYERFMQQYVFNQASAGKGVFSTRQDVWAVSWEKAVEGGVLGGGYGVSIGSRQVFSGGNWSNGFTAVGYGREKGNSQLAIVEEVGLVGLGLHALLMLALFWRLVLTFLSWPKGNERRALVLLTGVLAGMMVQSIFEAWWVAPGSPEYVYFWAMAGVAIGLSTYQPHTGKRAMEGPLRQRHRRQVFVAGGGAAF